MRRERMIGENVSHWYTSRMADMKPSKKEIEALEAQIKRDQQQPVKPAEKRIKLNVSFEKAMQMITRTRPRK